MLLELQNYFKNKKQKKEKIFIGSFINNYLLNLYIQNNIDIIRFDLEDFSLLYGYKDRRSVHFNYFRYLLKNIRLPYNIKMAIDVPFSSIYKKDNISGIIDFYTKTNCDILIFNLKDDIMDIVVKLIKMEIPIAINFTNEFKDIDLFEKNYKKIYNFLLEFSNIGVLMFILNSFPKNSIEQIKENISIPVISNTRDCKADGYYFEFFKNFNLEKNYQQVIKDYILELK